MIQDIGPELIERYKAKRKTEVSPATVNREIAFLKTMFNKAVEWGRLESSPLKNVKKFREPNSKDRILTPDEMLTLADLIGKVADSTDGFKEAKQDEIERLKNIGVPLAEIG